MGEVLEIKTNYVYLTGGLGNQLFQWACVSSITHERKVSIDGNNGSPRSDSGGNPDIFGFNILNVTTLSKKKSFNRLTKKAIGFNLRQHLKQNSTWRFYFFLKIIRLLASILISLQLRELIVLRVSRGLGFDPAIKQTKLNNYFVGYFQSYLWGWKSATVLRESLDLGTKSITVDRYVSLARIEKPLVVHIRLGDYLAESGFGIPGKEYYSDAISNQLASNIYKKIWLFSDEPNKALKIFPKNPGIEVRIIEQEGISPAETLEIMRQGRGYVIANSSFSYWGAYLSYSTNAVVICPKPWFRDLDEPQNLIPKDWKRSDARF